MDEKQGLKKSIFIIDLEIEHLNKQRNDYLQRLQKLEDNSIQLQFDFMNDINEHLQKE